uniref:Uncharacterized protein n=1 Tax=Romanomermis culicivorax TaxID=13658 RepID=A0A915KMM7_ROMCU
MGGDKSNIGTDGNRKEEQNNDDDSLLLWSETFHNDHTCHSSWRRQATKSDVLQFLAGAENVRLSKVNGAAGGSDDWQVTDESGFPLIDAWHELNFCNKFWRLETCGKTILNMSESLPWCMPLTYHSARSTVNVYDFNGDFYGAILTGIGNQQPILILSADRKVVAKIVSPR